MKKINLSVLLLFLSFGAQAQILQDYVSIKSNDLKNLLDKQLTMCPIEGQNWVNKDRMRPAANMKDKLTIVHFAQFGDIVSTQNMEVLTKIQTVFPDVRILLVHQAESGYPKTSADLLQELTTYQIPFPLLIDDKNALSTCLQSDQGTWFISPNGKIMQKKDGLLYFAQLEAALQKVLTNLNALKPTNKEPFLGNSPHKRAKIPLLQYPTNIAVNEKENFLYISDYLGNRVMAITPLGDLVLSIGDGTPGFQDGILAMTQLNGPRGVAYDGMNNLLYIADAKNHRIRKVDLTTNEVTTLLGSGNAGKPGQKKVLGTGGPINYPASLVLDKNKLYIVMAGTSEIWVCDVRTAVAERIAGSGERGISDGPALEAKLDQPMGLVLDKSGALFFTEGAKSLLRKLDKGQLTTVAGNKETAGYADGNANEIRLNHPGGMCLVDQDIYLADTYSHTIRKIAPFGVRSETKAGSATHGYLNGPGGISLFHSPHDVAHLNGVLYIADTGNNLIRKFDVQSGMTSSIHLVNYGILAQGYQPPILEIRDGDSIRIGVGNNAIEISLDLGDKYVVDPTGYSNISLVSREDSIKLIAPGFQNGKMQIEIRSEDMTSESTDLAIDFHLYFQNKEAKELQFYRNISFIYPIIKDPKGQTSHTITTKFDPDLKSEEDEGDVQTEMD